MLRNGIPEEMVQALRTVSSAFRSWGAQAKVTRPLRDGEALELRDRALQILHRPGHSPSDTVFWDAERRILIAADHLIKHISSNPLISRPLDRPDRDPVEAADDRPACAGHVHRARCARRGRCRPRSSSPATASRSPTTSR